MPHQKEKPSERAAFCFAMGRLEAGTRRGGFWVCRAERRLRRRKRSGALGSAAEQCRAAEDAQQCDTAQPGKVPDASQDIQS